MYLSLVSLPFLCATRSHLLVLSEKEKYQLEEEYKIVPGSVVVEHQRVTNLEACRAYLQKKFSKTIAPAVIVQGFSIRHIMRHISICSCIDSFDADTTFAEASDEEETMDVDESGITTEVKDAATKEGIIDDEYAFGLPEEVSSSSEEESEDDFEFSSDEDGEKMKQVKALYRFLKASVDHASLEDSEDPNDVGDRIFNSMMEKRTSDFRN